MKLVKVFELLRRQSYIQTPGQPAFYTKNNIFIKRGAHVRCFAWLTSWTPGHPKNNILFFMYLVKEFELLWRQCPTSKLHAN